MTNEPSPRPWRVGESISGTMSCIHDANGEHIASCFGMPTEADAALIVDAVNERDDLVENLKTAHANRERENAIWEMVVTKLKAERDRAVKYAEAAPHPGSAPWKEMQAVYAERDRLRDLVRRLLVVRENVFWRKDEKTGLLFEDRTIDEEYARKTIEEARAAIGEGEK